MIDKIVNIQNLDPNNFQLQNYSNADESLITNYTVDVIFDHNEDYLEYFILDPNKNIVYSNVTGYLNYTVQGNNIVIDPQLDLELQGFGEGEYYTLYNFLKRKISSSPDKVFYIQDISSDRTELRLGTTAISNTDVITLTSQFISEIHSSPNSFQDFYLNFGDNKLIIANNVLLDASDYPTVLIKLYEPLPSEFTYQSKCWIVEQIAESQAYQIALQTIYSYEEQLKYISGPNYNLDIKDQVNNTTSYVNQSTLQQNSSINGSGSLLSQINSLLIEKGIEINVDYNDYSEFTHFSSAQTRLENFYYKLSLIEEYTYNSNLSNTSPINNYTSGSQIIWDNKINDIITNFDGYEYYLYFSSESHAWPKTNLTAPYVNYNTTSLTSINWFTTQSISASYFDDNNNDALINSIPTYLREDSLNKPYHLFVQMVGQNFDNVWIYLKDITNKFNADNRLNYGISKDLVAQAIRDLGVKIYQNNFSSTDIYSSLLGLTPSGSNINIPYITGSLPTPTGYEYINTFVTSSDLNSLEPLDDVNKEIYKRIYHNLPLLLKKKGTPEGLRVLLNIYGVTDTILRINEFGGKSTSTSSNWDNFVDQFNYAFHTEGSGYMYTYLTSSILGDPNSIEFRFKTNGIPDVTPYYQTLVYNDLYTITLEYTGSRYASGSYSGSIVDPYNTYGTLKFINLVNNESSSIYLPFFDEGWWSVMSKYDISDATTYNKLYAKNNIYDGYDSNNIGFQGSSSILYDEALTGLIYLSYTSSKSIAGKTYYPFSGSFQEFRMYSNFLNETSFNDYVMNPYSIEGNDLTGAESSFNTLLFRAPLGTMLDNDTSSLTRVSIHPSISQIPSTASFLIGNSNYFLSGSFTFEPNYEIMYQDQFHSGIKNSVSEKIKIIDHVLPSGNTLSHYISIQQKSFTEENFTKNINYVEVAFSPQDEINDDIISQLGNFNIGKYIGDPRQVSSSLNYYPDFNKIRDEYFSKYTHSYNLWDYIRLIKFYDNSLFKMIKDFTPSRAGLTTGIVIKQTLLERNKYPLPQMNINTNITFVCSPTSTEFNIPY